MQKFPIKFFSNSFSSFLFALLSLLINKVLYWSRSNIEWRQWALWKIYSLFSENTRIRKDWTNLKQGREWWWKLTFSRQCKQSLVQNRGPKKEHGNAIYKYFFSTLTAMKISGEMFVQCDWCKITQTDWNLLYIQTV